MLIVAVVAYNRRKDAFFHDSDLFRNVGHCSALKDLFDG